jgi:hypothetical protein
MKWKAAGGKLDRRLGGYPTGGGKRTGCESSLLPICRGASRLSGLWLGSALLPSAPITGGRDGFVSGSLCLFGEIGDGQE